MEILKKDELLQILLIKREAATPADIPPTARAVFIPAAIAGPAVPPL